ncbi:HAD-IA family hydrolase [Chloroflexota bacterium]
MTVKAFITDLDGTLLTNTDTIVPGYATALIQIQKLGLKIVVVSNLPHRTIDNKLTILPINPDLVLTREDVGISKGSPRWIDRICNEFHLEKNEVVYIGDSDHDMQTAVNSKIIYFNAEWSKPGYRYGIPISSPDILPMILKLFFMKEHLWYWSVDSSDLREQPVIARALIKGRDIGVGNFKSSLINWAKYGIDSKVASITLSEFLLYLLLGTLYLDGIYSEIDTVAVIPGHSGGHNPLMEKSLNRMAMLFRETFNPSLLLRHTAARKSAFARRAGNSLTFQDQVITMCLSCDLKKQSKMIDGKTILIIDDFITEGFSTEWARNLLYNAGAEKVISVAIGAFHNSIEVQSIAKGLKWDSYNPVNIDDKYLSSNNVFATTNANALNIIMDSYRELSEM